MPTKFGKDWSSLDLILSWRSSSREGFPLGLGDVGSTDAPVGTIDVRPAEGHVFGRGTVAGGFR